MNDYRLLRAHRIGRVMQEPGYEFQLPAQTGDWLVAQGVAELIDVPAPQPKPTVQRAAAIPRLMPQPAPPMRCCGWANSRRTKQ